MRARYWVWITMFTGFISGASFGVALTLEPWWGGVGSLFLAVVTAWAWGRLAEEGRGAATKGETPR